MKYVAILGYGNIGSGVAKLLDEQRETLKKHTGEELVLKSILELRDLSHDPYGHLRVSNAEAVMGDPEISLVVETMGGVHPAYEFVREALRRGKSVCTSNKELIASKGRELLNLAKENSVNLCFEASVGGVIPIVNALYQAVTGDEILEVQGILNGTTNYMLHRMKTAALSFQEALKEAQEKGFAEKDPTNDVRGYDACRKIAILSGLAYGKEISYEDVATEGIESVSAEDIAYAEDFQSVLKLVARSSKTKDGIRIAVSPALLSMDHPLANVSGVTNAVVLRGTNMGELMFQGAGAGQRPTAAAILSDLVTAVRNEGRPLQGSYTEKEEAVLPSDDEAAEFFLRVRGRAEDYAEVLKELSADTQVRSGRDDGFACRTGSITRRALEPLLKRMPVISCIRFLA